MRVRLSPRLQACAAFCRPGSRIADVGTDHALLPLYLLQSGTACRAIASDINPEPLARAAENIERFCFGSPELRDKISLVLCGGLDKISPSDVDDIFIAGMGGDLISDIISAAPWLRGEHYRLILQPMSKPERLRARLCELGFETLGETPVIDSGKIYSVMRCEYPGEHSQPYVPEIYELFCGRVALSITDEDTREAAARYLGNARRRLEDVKKGAVLSGDHPLAAKYGGAIEKITEILETYGK